MIWMVAIGGGAGSVVRYLLGTLVSRSSQSAFPLGTFLINVLGSLILGFVIGLRPGVGLSDRTTALLAIGFCGGFTTFSTFSLETVRLIESGRLGLAGGYVAGSVTLSLVATAVGLVAAKAIRLG